MRYTPARYVLILLALLVCSQPAAATEYLLFYLGGQSNMDGYGRCDELPQELKGPVPGVMIFHGNTAPDGAAVDGRGIWAELAPGHGVGYTSDGESATYSDRFGIELTFARRLQELLPDANIAIIKYSRGGTSIDQAAASNFGCWDPDYTGGTVAGVNQYDHFLATIRHAAKACDIDGDGENDRLIPAGIVWMQGESDAAHGEAIARRYQANLKRLIDLIRAALRSDDLPVAIGRISDSGRDDQEKDGKVWNHGEIVRSGQASFVAEDGHAILVTSTDEYDYSDPWHYDSHGYIELGKSFAEALVERLSRGRELQIDLPVADGAVLQRGVEVPIRGSAGPGAKVEVSCNGRTYGARADASGRWQVKLPPMPAGGPFELTVVAAGELLQISNLLVGDVWLCSGQSNMEWVVADSLNAEQEIAAAPDPMIRHFKVPRSWAARPESALAGGSWESADPEHVGSFTAVGTFFARALREQVEIPIGLINSSWGGSRIEPWMSADALGLDTVDVDTIVNDEKVFEAEVLAAIRDRIGELPDYDHGMVDGRALWAAPDLDDSTWDQLPVPSAWEEAGFPGMDGIAWYRTSFELSDEEAAGSAQLGLAFIDDSDQCWVNGHEVGRTELAWNRLRVYQLVPAVLEPGRNTIAVRVEDTGGGGGIWGDPKLLYIDTGSRRIPLAGTWRFQVGVATVNLEFHKSQLPTMLHNSMIHPLYAYPIAGVLWYQGESNAGGADASAYRTLFPAMISSWRQGWQRDDLPFLFVQLANYLSEGQEPAISSWAVLRESQAAALSLANTAQVVAIDIGDPNDIHPRNKQEVGRRLSLAARRLVYGEELVYSGPVYRGHEIEDGRIRVHFDHTGSGLVLRGDTDPGASCFAVAGSDRRFLPAQVGVEEDQIVVWNDEVSEPVALRYAWADSPTGELLYNREGLPASPFRTDSW